VLTFAITAGPIRGAGASPWSAYRRFLVTPLTSAYSVQEVLLTATPLLLTGLAVAVAFRAGYFNIGAEGQFLAGAMGATLPGIHLAELPAGVALPLALGAGASAGLLWALLPAWLKRVAGIDEVVTTLLLNPVALLLLQGLLNGPWRHPISGFPDSETFGPGYRMPTLLGSERVHAGLLIALVIVAGTAAVMAFTPLGLRVKAAGQSPDAARFSGIDVVRIRWWAALGSGAIAGLAGASQVLGVQHQLTGSIAVGYGYTGIVVATLGGLSAIGVLFVGLLLGLIGVGSQNASLVLQIPQQVGQLVTAVLLLTVVSCLVLRHYRIVRRRAITRADGIEVSA
jgi:simple sugar transport system permease protein